MASQMLNTRSRGAALPATPLSTDPNRSTPQIRVIGDTARLTILTDSASYRQWSFETMNKLKENDVWWTIDREEDEVGPRQFIDTKMPKSIRGVTLEPSSC
jgi:hypothetical protein